MDRRNILTPQDFKNIPEGKAIVDEIERKHKKGLLNIIKVIGLPGTGKSWLCLRLAELVSLRLHNENRIKIDNVVDNLLDLLRIVRWVKEPGEIVIIEEAEVLFPSRRSMSGDNVDATKIFDTIRKKKMIVLLNYPLNKSVDNRIEAMCNLEIETLKIYKTAGKVLCKPMRLQTNPGSGKVYRHRLINDGKDIQRSLLSKPSYDLTIQYEQKKDNFLSDLYHSLEKKQQKRLDTYKANAGIPDENKNVKPLTKRQSEIYDLFIKEALKPKDISKRLKLGQKYIEGVLRVVKKKVYMLENAKKSRLVS